MLGGPVACPSEGGGTWRQCGMGDPVANNGGENVSRIAQALGGAVRTTNGWDARCPAHDDGHASLSLSTGAGDRLLWKCHAGCGQAAVHDALDALGLLRTEKRQRTGTVVAAYDYRDEAGKQIFQVVRFEPKTFRQRRPARPGDDPAKVKDGWCWAVRGIRPLLYRLPEVLAAVRAGKTVYVVEGEKDANWLVTLKLAATCNAGGAGKWKKDHAQPLKSADVIVIPDNDDAGHKHAQEVAQSLAGLAARVRIVELPGLPDKGDVSDWLSRGHTVAELQAIAEAAPTWRPSGGEAAASERSSASTLPAQWHTALIRTKRGEVKGHLANAATALRQAPEWQDVLAFNQLKSAVEIAAPPPWELKNGAWEGRAWTDNDDVRAAEWMQRQGIDIGHTTAHAAVAEVAERNAYHPVRRYLDGLVWDETERIQHFAHDILGSQDDPLLRTVSQAMLIAAVARVMSPGCKADNIPVLEGPQGQLKSTAVRTLFAPWFIDDIADLGSKDATDQLRKTWCAEIADLAGMRRADVEKIKAFASRCVDIYRPAYGRAVIEAPRHAVMWATTNHTEWIKDDTGARRFWPISCGRIDVKRIERERGQLWAEALHWWRRGEPWWLTDRATVDLAREAQESRQVVDAWDDRVAEYVDGKADVSVGEILQFGLVIEPGKWGQSEQNRIARYLRRKGWTRRYAGPRSKQRWRYFSPQFDVDSSKNQMELAYSESGL